MGISGARGTPVIHELVGPGGRVLGIEDALHHAGADHDRFRLDHDKIIVAGVQGHGADHFAVLGQQIDPHGPVQDLASGLAHRQRQLRFQELSMETDGRPAAAVSAGRDPIIVPVIPLEVDPPGFDLLNVFPESFQAAK